MPINTKCDSIQKQTNSRTIFLKNKFLPVKKGNRYYSSIPKNNVTRIFKILTIILLYSSSLLAHNYYVSNLGSDSKKGTKKKPFLTINHAAEVANPGDTVFVKIGNYFERVKTKRSGTKDAKITFISSPRRSVKVRIEDNICMDCDQGIMGEAHFSHISTNLLVKNNIFAHALAWGNCLEDIDHA